ncbi:M48 family metallopeptidase [Brevundimonas sp. GCM10030266]|uniref:M48 family metallopeptidase n=1 Tax=Brevundimonas sp. GCM10030266 TaxID=3273386 RepID=UPI00360D4124
MDARFYDGVTARSHPAEAEVDGETLRIVADEREFLWSLKDVSVEVEADQARVSNRRQPDARLVLPIGDWTPLVGDQLNERVKARRHREWWLIGGLTATAVGVVLFITVGVPALSGPVARATPVSMEERMGDNINAQMSTLFPACKNPAGQRILDQLGDRIAARADTPFDIRVRAVDAPMVNAFATPGGRIMITGELIQEAESPDELAAVIAHEIAHVEQRHVMQAVWRNFGIGMLLDLVVGGGTGAGQQAVILAGQASELSYSRSAETEADARGQALLHAGGLSSEGMAPFFERLAGKGERSGVDEATEFMNSHPDSARRARVARAAARPGRSALTAEEWRTVRQTCAVEDSENPVERLRRRFGLGDNEARPNKSPEVRPDGQ